jgi:hypothetical protein
VLPDTRQTHLRLSSRTVISHGTSIPLPQRIPATLANTLTMSASRALQASAPTTEAVVIASPLKFILARTSGVEGFAIVGSPRTAIAK